MGKAQSNSTSVDWEAICASLTQGEHPDQFLNEGLTHHDALTLAVHSAHLPAINAFIEAGCDVNARDAEGFAAIHHAVQAGHSNVVMALVQRGADPNLLSGSGESALSIATRKGLCVIAQTLIQQGANPNQQVDGGRTALSLAAAMSRRQICTILLDAGADPSITDHLGRSALASLDPEEQGDLRARLASIEMSSEISRQTPTAPFSGDPQTAPKARRI